MTIVCPKCNSDNYIQKISAIVASGVTSGFFSGPTGGVTYSGGKVGTFGSFTNLSGSPSTELARLLVRPNEPHQSFLKRGTVLIVWLVIAAPVLCLTIFGFSVVVPIIGSSSANFSSKLLGNIYSIFCGAMYIIAWIVGIPLSRSRNKKDEEKYASNKAIYDKAIEKWNRLYYCHHHDIVFDPQSGISFEPSQTSAYIYES
jgi:hypothetical protein